MNQAHSSCMLVLAAALFASSPALAQGTDKEAAKASIAGKAVTAKQAPAKASTERKKFEFVAEPAAQQSSKPTAERSAPAYLKDKSTCHSQGSDA